MMKKLWLVLLFMTLDFSLLQAQDAEGRAFHLGFTPFPYDIAPEAVLDVYQQIGQQADLIVHHFDNGVPWPEALAHQPYAQAIQDDWQWRRNLTPPAQQVLLAVTPISTSRRGLADYRGEADNMPLPAPFDQYTFDHPEVIAAFSQYCDTIITYFQPDYFLFGIEVNLLMKNAPEHWEAYMTLHRAVYSYLKERYPALPIFVSITGGDAIPGYSDADPVNQAMALADVLPYTDILGLSLYPYMTQYLTNSLPLQLLSQLSALTDKPLAVTESGYPAQNFTLKYAGLELEFVSDENKQAAWLDYLLESAQEYQFLFVVNFVLRDYDAVWRWLGSNDRDLTIVWRDTGLLDENGMERQALRIWRTWLARPYTGG